MDLNFETAVTTPSDVSTSNSRKDLLTHKIERGTQKACVVCLKNNCKTEAGYRIRSTWQCENCKVALCKDGCFYIYHKDDNQSS